MNDNLVEQLQSLSELHRQGSLSAQEFEAAKARLLGEGSGVPQTLPNLLVLQNELADLDRQWTLEREKYKVVTRYNSSIPEPESGTETGNAQIIFGVIWTLVATFIAFKATTTADAPLFFWLFPAVGVFIVVKSLGMGDEINAKADAHQFAERQYQSRRVEIEAKIQAAK